MKKKKTGLPKSSNNWGNTPYSKKLEGSVVSTVRRGLTTDTRPTSFVAFPSYETLNCKSV
jgi:hypothetical protein